MNPEIYVKGYGFLSFAKNSGKIYAINIVKNFLIVLKKSATDAIKTDSKRAIQKTAEATGDLIGNKIADKIISVPKKSAAHSKKLENDNTNDEVEAPKKDTYVQKIRISRQKIIYELRLV